MAEQINSCYEVSSDSPKSRYKDFDDRNASKKSENFARLNFLFLKLTGFII